MTASAVRRIRNGLLIAGGVSVAGCILSGFLDTSHFFQSYLFAAIFWTELPIGALIILMILPLVGGEWGRLVSIPLRATARTFPVAGLLFIPVLAGIGHIYSWAETQHGARALTGVFQQLYLSLYFYIPRTVACFVIWIALAHGVLRERSSERLKRWCAPGLVVMGLTGCMSSWDWMMSLEPKFHSTAFGPIVLLGETLQAISFAIAVLWLFRELLKPGQIGSRKALADLGSFLQVAVLGWTYLHFMQYLVLWSGDLPDAVGWYVHRTRGGWEWLVLILAICQAGVPAFALLFRPMKLRPDRLAWIAGLILLARIVDVYWFVAPSFYREGFYVPVTVIPAFGAVGAIWLAAFLTFLLAELETPALGSAPAFLRVFASRPGSPLEPSN